MVAAHWLCCDCDKPPPDEVQACCDQDGNCTDVLVSECLGAGGVPQGAGTSCGDPGICTGCFNCPQLLTINFNNVGYQIELPQGVGDCPGGIIENTYSGSYLISRFPDTCLWGQVVDDEFLGDTCFNTTEEPFSCDRIQLASGAPVSIFNNAWLLPLAIKFQEHCLFPGPTFLSFRYNKQISPCPMGQYQILDNVGSGIPGSWNVNFLGGTVSIS